MDKKYLIDFIVSHNPSMRKKELKTLSIETLVIIKVQAEIDRIKNTC